LSLPPVIFVLLQTSAAADGGVASISEVISRLRQHRPIIVTDRETPRVAGWRSRGFETHVVPLTGWRGLFRNPLSALRAYWRYARELRRIIKSSGAKLIHANDPLAFQLALWPARSAGIGIVLNIRDTMNPDRRQPRRRYRFLFKAADHVFYLSRDMADRWAEIAPNAKRACSVTYSIVDPERFAPCPPPTAQPPVVLLCGLVCPKKGQLDFLRHVAPTLAAEGVATWLAGDFDPSANAYMAACAKAAAPLGDAVRFLGYRTDVAGLMGRSTAVAVASRYEGLVRSMIEAMSCARPVVSFDVSSARELLEIESGGAGQVVRQGDHQGMARAILAYCRDPRLASEAGEKGRETAARMFAPASVVAKYERVYEAVGARHWTVPE
jgi:glycosyltransferase involved in cell wall biosynthesis